MTEDYRDYFQVGDLICLQNADLPAWGRGTWRVESVTRREVRLQPEGDPADRFPCSVRDGGLVENVCRWPRHVITATDTIQ
jgi:hypothetical protein